MDTMDSRDAMPGLGRYAIAERSFLSRVFGWMGFGLLLTAVVAWYVGTPERFAAIFGASRAVIWIAFIGQLVLVFAIGGAVKRLNASLASTLFVAYSALMGLTLSGIFLMYTQASIFQTFLASGVTFGCAAAYGALTKKDLSSFGNILFMLLIGVIVTSLVNLLLKSTAVTWLTSFVGLFVFTGLAAVDMQKLKAYHQSASDGGDRDKALAVGGALTLYLDFINIFLILLRFMGDRR